MLANTHKAPESLAGGHQTIQAALPKGETAFQEGFTLRMESSCARDLCTSPVIRENPKRASSSSTAIEKALTP